VETVEVLEAGAVVTAEITRAVVEKTMETGVEQLSRFGRLVLRAWKWFEDLSNPPWTRRKVFTWAVLFLTVGIITVIAYQFKYGILTLPIIAEAGGRFVAWLAGLGPLGLFGFTAVGTLFFMVIPTEPFFFIALAGQMPAAAAVAAAALGSTVGSVANYWIGNRLRVSAGKKKPGEERELGRWGKRAHSKWGALLLFLAAALPVPELVAVAYGLADFPAKKFLLITLVARAVKWSWVAAAFILFQFTL
jgi:membrane protein YqaA with SNARE-associated domain